MNNAITLNPGAARVPSPGGSVLRCDASQATTTWCCDGAPWELLVHRARQGDTDAFAALVEEFGPRVHAYLVRVMGSASDAEDLLQDTLVKAYRMLPGFREPRAFPAWLFVIARRTALNHLRSERLTQDLDPDLADPGHTPAEAAQAEERAASLWTLARRVLKPGHFEVLWLHYAQELPVQDIARVTRRTRIHVRVILHRARQTLAHAVRSSRIPTPPVP